MLYPCDGRMYVDADREAARARARATEDAEDESESGRVGEDARGVLPACGDVECEFGGAGGMICAASSPVLDPPWLERGEWLALVGTLTRGPIDGSVFTTEPSRGVGMNALSASGGGVGR